MTERQLERLDIIEQLIGNTRGIGETNADNKALSNIDFAAAVLEDIITSLAENARYDGFEASRQEIRDKSKTVLKDIVGIIAD